ncbi:tannase/feruloyl esterase family alpha/beta hydrolase [Paraburkholderia sp.]|uniref:tannase/feruloyl esterase family alpha/beta hydrolase n=1 Tax=Paraburkholderia sp. TaxID=1926495 RepID=UPI003D6F1208
MKHLSPFPERTPVRIGPNPLPLAAAIVLTTVTALAGCGSSTSSVSAVPVAKPLACSDVTSAKLGIPGLTVTAATDLPASAPNDPAGYPEHCQVTGNINPHIGIDGNSYAIGFDVRLPVANWNGKFVYSGDGGLDGAILSPLGNVSLASPMQGNALSRGYAVVSSDGGHIAAPGVLYDGTFGRDPQARADYAYNALGTMTVAGKSLVTTFYGRAPTRSYYMGCSKGGQSGIMAAGRFADQYDGIIAGAPGIDMPRLSIAQIFDTQQALSVSANPASAFAPQDLQLVSQKILARCDALDGATDGIVSDTAACQAAFNFDTDVPQCASGMSPDGTCLSASQKAALKAIFAGPRNSVGDVLYANWPWDAGVGSSAWSSVKFGVTPQLGTIAMGNVWATPPTAVDATNALAYARGFSLDNAFNLIYGTNATFPVSSMDLMMPPDPTHLSTLKSHGKLLVYHGTADPLMNVNATIGWYNQVRAGDPQAPDYVRLFLVPGMNHCLGGMSTDAFDMLTTLSDWVEKGIAPDSVPATVTASNPDLPASWSRTRSRPLCPYPQKAVLKSGATDLEAAGSFACQ